MNTAKKMETLAANTAAAKHSLQLATASKKHRILELFEKGMGDLMEIAEAAGAKPSYVAQTLQRAGHIQGYHDLYTSTGIGQNVYSPYFRNVLSFKTVEAARHSVAQIDALYRRFEQNHDRAGQHHAMMLALVGQNRARWIGKDAEAKIFHDWLVSH